MELLDSIDPFVMQLVIVPFIVIGIGVLASVFVKKFYIAPLVTLILNALYEVMYMKIYFSSSDFSFTSWNIIFPLISLIIASIIADIRKQKQVFPDNVKGEFG
ncbi:hypothetical protein FIU87_19190 [Bacillus sp. THAF10]|uniref:DUF2651 family protein n=1 Tax=Bacillus sp. THAF10 TaxID=2587848 RepID=UPI00126887BD|nr:hypothetical protein [Bacillus sp. THAF10]QFT90774.1 hypothetical protein FIU87_19190 [Bacillus sp. THAF10]